MSTPTTPKPVVQIDAASLARQIAAQRHISLAQAQRLALRVLDQARRERRASTVAMMLHAPGQSDCYAQERQQARVLAAVAVERSPSLARASQIAIIGQRLMREGCPRAAAYALAAQAIDEVTP